MNPLTDLEDLFLHGHSSVVNIMMVISNKPLVLSEVVGDKAKLKFYLKQNSNFISLQGQKKNERIWYDYIEFNVCGTYL